MKKGFCTEYVSFFPTNNQQVEGLGLSQPGSCNVRLRVSSYGRKLLPGPLKYVELWPFGLLFFMV